MAKICWLQKNIFLGFFIAQQFSVLGADLVSGDIEFFFRIADRKICQHKNFMPRKARIDVPGALHHVIAKGIDVERIAERVAETLWVGLPKRFGLRENSRRLCRHEAFFVTERSVNWELVRRG